MGREIRGEEVEKVGDEGPGEVREVVDGREGIMRAVISVADLVSWVCTIIQ